MLQREVIVIALTASAAVQELLAGVREKAEILDAAGKVLGIYTPLGANEAEMYERAKALFDPVEMERLAVEYRGKGRPLAEIWKDLHARESSR
jgi:hypothetical protein